MNMRWTRRFLWFVSIAGLAGCGAVPVKSGPLPGTYSATVIGPLPTPKGPIDARGLVGRQAVGTRFDGSFSVADGDYAQTVSTKAEMSGRSGGRPSLISIRLNLPAGPHIQSDRAFNAVRCFSSSENGQFDQFDVNANDVTGTGHTTETIMHMVPARPLHGRSLRELIDSGFTASGNQLQFFEFLDGQQVGGFVARIDRISAAPLVR